MYDPDDEPLTDEPADNQGDNGDVHSDDWGNDTEGTDDDS